MRVAAAMYNREMAERSRRRNLVILIVLLLLALVLMVTCYRRKPVPSASRTEATDPGRSESARGAPEAPAAATRPQEKLTTATLSAPTQVAAGAGFTVAWTGPDNPGDFVTIVQGAALAREHGQYQETQHGASLQLTAPISPGSYELRYVTAQSRTVLARAPIEVLPTTATLTADETVILGAPFPVSWSGPDNAGDYITIVARDAPDTQYGDYENTATGSVVTLTAPSTAGDAELRYVAGQGRKVLARRPIRVTMPEVGISAPESAIAGSKIQLKWTGPNNAGDYVTVVARQTPDGQYGNYASTSAGATLELLIPIMSGDAELRYMTGQGNKVLARRNIKIVAAEVKLSAPPRTAPGAEVAVTWTGPDYPGDYITIVRAGTPDGQYAKYTETSRGSPLSVVAPSEAGDAEIRYMTGQGNKVLARIALQVVP